MASRQGHFRQLPHVDAVSFSLRAVQPVALVGEPVLPTLRNILADEYDRIGLDILAAAIRAKKLDKDDEVKAALSAMRKVAKLK